MIGTRHKETLSIVIILKVGIFTIPERRLCPPFVKKEEVQLGARTRLNNKGGNEEVSRAAALGASKFLLTGCIALLACSLPFKGLQGWVGERGF